jgi:hypothetical protein
MKEGIAMAKSGMRMVIEILLEITEDKEEYARLYDQILADQSGIDEARRIELKEHIEEARKRDHQYYLGLLQDSTKEKIKDA